MTHKSEPCPEPCDKPILYEDVDATTFLRTLAPSTSHRRGRESQSPVRSRADARPRARWIHKSQLAQIAMRLWTIDYGAPLEKRVASFHCQN
ncbi:hypothetical protein A0H81_14186 [Grifola frondosa]|uniref:Uncharacterized protein n=1 Tax=Grifola frondosa TaxID=5627 RepID=A0A1C7LPM6_GRIFR|nr:hypothetical protein A0H81_14186 [Grifola frondosa]